MFRKGLTALTILVSAGVLAASVRLRWDPNSESDLAGYRMYVRVSPFTNDFAVFDIAAPSTSFEWTNAVVGTEYEFSVTAYSTAGLESDRSTGLRYKLTNSVSVLVFPSAYSVRSNQFK